MNSARAEPGSRVVLVCRPKAQAMKVGKAFRSGLGDKPTWSPP